MPKYYRYLAPAEIQFYGLDPASQFIITRKIKFEVGLRHVTIPKGYVCRGVGLSYQDFCVPPGWAAYEYMYATHRTDRAVCTREEADLFLFNTYPDDMNLVGDELFCSGLRVSGEDFWASRLEQGVVTVPELVTPTNIFPGTATKFSSTIARTPIDALLYLIALVFAMILAIATASVML